MSENHGPFVDEYGLLWVPIPAIAGRIYELHEWEQLGFIYHGRDQALIRQTTTALNKRVYSATAWLASARKRYNTLYPEIDLGEPVIRPRQHDPEKTARALYALYNQNIWDDFEAYTRNWEYYKFAAACANAYGITEHAVRREINALALEAWDRFGKLDYAGLLAEHERRRYARSDLKPPQEPRREQADPQRVSGSQ